MKDSGQRIVFPGGGQRDDSTGKGRFDLISPIALQRLAVIYEGGAIGKGDRNWENGLPMARSCICSAMRHTTQLLLGLQDEDHAVMAAWNLFAFAHIEHLIAAGKIDAEVFADMPNGYTPQQTEYYLRMGVEHIATKIEALQKRGK